MKEFLNKANEFFEKGLNQAKKGAKVAGEKFAQIEEETKNRLSIVENEKKLDKLFRELGKKEYQFYLNNKSKKEEGVRLLCEEIDEVLKEKTNLEKNVLKLKDLVVCENCNNTIDITCTFCPYCGYLQEDVEHVEHVEHVEEVKKEAPKKKTTTAKKTTTKTTKTTTKKTEPKKKTSTTKKAEPKVATVKLEKNKK